MILRTNSLSIKTVEKLTYHLTAQGWNCLLGRSLPDWFRLKYKAKLRHTHFFIIERPFKVDFANRKIKI